MYSKLKKLLDFTAMEPWNGINLHFHSLKLTIEDEERYDAMDFEVRVSFAQYFDEAEEVLDDVDVRKYRLW